jgi:iron complex outermembrane receptor protein
LGAFYLHTERDLRTRGFVDLTGDVSQIDNPLLVIIDNQESNDNDAYALYGQFDLDLTERLTLSGALRYDEDQREQTNLLTSAVRERSFDSVQPKATLTYRFTPDALAYATYSTGFRSGGFNAPGVSLPLFLPEELTNFEIGFKTSWLNRRLIVNGAAFFANDENFQYFFVDALSASQIIGNIDEVEISGVELEVQARLAEGLDLYAGLGTTDSEIQANSIDPSSVGNRAPKTTEWSFNAGLQYEWDMSSDWSALLRVDWEHQGDKYWQLDNADVQEPIDLLNLRFGVRDANWSVFLSGRNVLDTEYYADFNPREYSGLDIDIGSPGQTQTWSIELRRNF